MSVERLLNIVSRGEEIWRKVKGRWIISWHSVVVHRGAVEVVTPLTVRPPMSRVHNMADSQFPQTVAFVGHGPVDRLGLLGKSFQNKSEWQTYMSPRSRLGQTSSTWLPDLLPPYKTVTNSLTEGVTLQTGPLSWRLFLTGSVLIYQQHLELETSCLDDIFRLS